MRFGFDRHLRPGSIRVKLTLLVATIVAATAGLTFWFAYAQMSGDLEREIDHRLSVIAKDRVELLRRHIDAQQVQIRLIGRSPVYRALLKQREDEHLADEAFQAAAWVTLDDTRIGAKDVAAMCIVDTQGKILASTDIDWTGKHTNEVFGDYLPCSDGAVGTLWAHHGRRVGLVCAPISAGDGRELGELVVVGDFEPALATIEERSELGTSSRLLIAEKRGENIRFFSPEIGECPGPYALVDHAAAGGNGMLRDETRFGEPILAAYQSVGHRGWVLAIVQDKREAYAPVRELRDRLILLFVAVLVAGWVAAFQLSRSFTRPILDMAQAAERIRAGELAVHVQVRSSDEIGRLSESFNRMSAELERSYQTLEHRVQERTAELEAVNAELSSFSHSVAHDLRAPLRAISGYADILVEEKARQLDPEAREMIARMRHNATRLGRLIDDLMTFSGIGRRELHIERIDPRGVVRDVLDDLAHDMRGRNVEVDVHELPLCLADDSLVSLVFSNLLSNAVKYTQPRALARIVVGCDTVNGEDVFFVRDNGVGFDMRYAADLFGLFQRLHGKNEFEGTGMGLAIARRVVERHGGRIWAEAELHKGATFFFTLQEARPLPRREPVPERPGTFASV